MDKYQEALENYYTIKGKYDKKAKKAKKTKKCIKCNKNGGTSFTHKNRILKAVCGASNKCKLHIEIKLAKYENIPSFLDKTFLILEELKEEIIRIKLNLLFTFENKKNTATAFKKIKTMYSQHVELFNELESKMKHTHIESELVTDLYYLIDTYKKSINDYLSTKNTSILKDAVELYVEQIVPKQEEIRELIHMSMVEEGEEYRLVKRRKNLESLEYMVEKGRVISNIA